MTMFRMADYRVVLSLAMSAVAGTIGLHAYPFPPDHPVLQLIHLARPGLYAGFYVRVRHAVVYVSLLPGQDRPRVRFDLLSAAGHGARPPRRCRRTGAGRSPGSLLRPGRAPSGTPPARGAQSTWLTTPERGLYTGIVVVGAIESRKTSACMYSYIDQLLAYRADDSMRKAAGLVLEVTGDSCRHVRAILKRYRREVDYVEVSLDSP